MRPARACVSRAVARRSHLSFLAVLVAGVSCGGGKSAPVGPPVEERPARSAAAEAFEGTRDAFFEGYLERTPTFAASIGFHKYDGMLPDVSARGLSARGEWLRTQQAAFEAVPPGELEPENAIEREVILTQIRGDRFDLEVARWPFTNPMSYIDRLSLSDYISRDYAPLAQRARAVIALSLATKPYLEAAQRNLPEAMPRTWIETALLQIDGLIEFVDQDVTPAFRSVDDPMLRTEVADALRAYAEALVAYREFLRGRLRKATDDFALGTDRFHKMLSAKEGVTIDLPRLRRVGEEDLAHNLAILELAARAIDPKKPVAAAVDQVKREKSDADKVLAEATTQARAMRKLLVDKKIVTIPSEDAVEVRATPPFMRWNFAFLSSPGVFEQKPLPSFYYISPPDPSWPRQEQVAYVLSHADLLYTTVHEVWPGHFLQYLHQKRVRSRILRTFCTYSAVEGWAHYAEQMMHQEGASGEDPKLAVGQLTNALLRNVRFISAIGLHTAGMTVRDSMTMFETQAFAERPTARQQAARGTFDPGYLNYTLGKLMIRKLRDDWARKVGQAYSLKAFHDTFLSYGCAPVPVIRRAMLGPDAGPAL
jgi:uncharacterized protein (DUF885 family)